MTLVEGKKLNMSQIFLDSGQVVPVTIIGSIDAVTSAMENVDVTVIGTSKGKGFTGVMKRWGFHGGDATHGQKHDARKAGAIGAQTPGKVFKGKKMAGRKGNKRVSIKGLRVVKVLPEVHQVMVSGAVPGARNSKIVLKFESDIDLGQSSVAATAAALPAQEK
jgi:ribosomal protein L3